MNVVRVYINHMAEDQTYIRGDRVLAALTRAYSAIGPNTILAPISAQEPFPASHDIRCSRVCPMCGRP